MEKETMNCMECNQPFQFTPNPSFPRKYCDVCSRKKKEEWKAKQSQPVQPVQPVQPQQTIPQTTQPKSKEFHLSEEAIRIGALKCAIAYEKNTKQEIGVVELARQFETYLRKG